MAASDDTPMNRCVTTLVTALVFGVFGLGTLVLLFAGSSDNWRDIEGPAAAARETKLDAYNESIAAAPKVDASTAVTILADSKPVKTEQVVPGSPTSLKPSEQKHDPAESELLN